MDFENKENPKKLMVHLTFSFLGLEFKIYSIG